MSKEEFDNCFPEKFSYILTRDGFAILDDENKEVVHDSLHRNYSYQDFIEKLFISTKQDSVKLYMKDNTTFPSLSRALKEYCKMNSEGR